MMGDKLRYTKVNRFEIYESNSEKHVRSSEYNYSFSKLSGLMLRYGNTVEQSPVVAPSFEILDWELSSKCEFNCPVCYKSNNLIGRTISFNNFKHLFDKIIKINPFLTQIAFGIGSLSKIPQLPAILRYVREHGIVPNITIASHEPINDTTIKILKSIKDYCGAVSISEYENFVSEIYNSDLLMTYFRSESSTIQVNLHKIVAAETYDLCFDVLERINYHMINKKYSLVPNAVTFLWPKPIGRSIKKYHPVNKIQLNALISYASRNNITLGFDSCSTPFVSTILKNMNEIIEPCESTLFSAYLSVTGDFYPCSFSTCTTNPININDIETNEDLWFSKPFVDFRVNCLRHNRTCNLFNLGGNTWK